MDYLYLFMLFVDLDYPRQCSLYTEIECEIISMTLIFVYGFDLLFAVINLSGIRIAQKVTLGKVTKLYCNSPRTPFAL